jgi:hypothetical protein
LFYTVYLLRKKQVIDIVDLCIINSFKRLSTVALPVLKGTIREYGYKGRGTVTLSNGKDLALRGGPNDMDERVPKPGDPVYCQIFYSADRGTIVVGWEFE